ncbi:hypothetical protein CLOM_g16620 [Closterium sp. NIES-68]|nr:hypothetical protein CLOM_g16620 [Closterium sp. NIES-68]GJP72769.1 hypothetical protein CLOP_g3514 [Closterium sp. NIES-67]
MHAAYPAAPQPGAYPCQQPTNGAPLPPPYVAPQVQVPTQPYAVVGPQYCLPYETVLVMKEKMFSIRDKKEVRDTNGNLHFKVADRLLSIPAKTTIQDATGAPVCMLVSKMLTLHSTTFLCPGNSGATGNYLFKAKKSIFTFCPILKVFLRGNDTKNPDILLSGSFFQHDFRIHTSNGMLLAEVKRDLFTARDLVFDTQTYYVRVMPNADMALVLALVTLADTIFVDNEGSGVDVGYTC